MIRKLIIIFLLIAPLSSCSPKISSSVSDKAQDKEKPKDPSTSKYRKVVFIIGDGMGLAQISTAIYSSRQRNEFERFKHVGFHKAYSSNDLITDSAAGATAFSIGMKTSNEYLGIDSLGIPHKTILEEAAEKGYGTGIVVTSTIVHATPAAFLAHNKNRNAYEEIALDIIDSGCDILIGGGEKFFNRRESDTIDLIRQFENKNYLVSNYFRRDYSEIIIPSGKKFLYFTADGDPQTVAMGRTYLPKASIDALNFLAQKNTNGFLMIEGSQIDWAGHDNDTKYLLEEMEDFNRMLGKVLDWAENDGNTLVVVTADHETGGLTIMPGSEWGHIKTNYSTKSHTGVLIPVFAFGPGAENFGGIYENTELYKLLKKALF